jgi:hypothetical protein
MDHALDKHDACMQATCSKLQPEPQLNSGEADCVPSAAFSSLHTEKRAADSPLSPVALFKSRGRVKSHSASRQHSASSASSCLSTSPVPSHASSSTCPSTVTVRTHTFSPATRCSQIQQCASGHNVAALGLPLSPSSKLRSNCSGAHCSFTASAATRPSHEYEPIQCDLLRVYADGCADPLVQTVRSRGSASLMHDGDGMLALQGGQRKGMARYEEEKRIQSALEGACFEETVAGGVGMRRLPPGDRPLLLGSTVSRLGHAGISTHQEEGGNNLRRLGKHHHHHYHHHHHKQHHHHAVDEDRSECLGQSGTCLNNHGQEMQGNYRQPRQSHAVASGCVENKDDGKGRVRLQPWKPKETRPGKWFGSSTCLSPDNDGWTGVWVVGSRLHLLRVHLVSADVLSEFGTGPLNRVFFTLSTSHAS